MKLIARLHAKFGDFWWWSLCLFVALRCGDAINAFVGLWLVPKYVGQEQLGAVLPLLQATSVFGLPISILVMTFTKFLNHYNACGKPGKVKALIQSFWGMAILAVVAGGVVASVLLPLFFERIRIVSGSLGVLIIATSVLTATSPVFTNALQALKRFRALTVMNLLCAPIRLGVMLVTMPIRALSGYMVGQAAPPLFQIAWSYLTLRREMRPSVKAESFWREDWRKILWYMTMITIWYSPGPFVGALTTMVIRQRLSVAESAAYYMISRFAELGTYAGVSMAVVMYPYVAEHSENDRAHLALFFKSTIATIGFGACCILGLWLFLPVFGHLIPQWAAYSNYLPDLLLLALTMLLTLVAANFNVFEAAGNRFRFLFYAVPLCVIEGVFLVCFTGCDYFRGILPDQVVDWMVSLNVATLRNVILVMLIYSVVVLLCSCVHIVLRLCQERR